jgi:hypothetical protein
VFRQKSARKALRGTAAEDYMNCEECRKEFLESEEDSFVSITAVIHRFFFRRRREIEEDFGRAIELLRDDLTRGPRGSLLDRTCPHFRSRRGKNPFRRW